MAALKLPDPLVPPLDDNRQLCELYATALGSTPAAIAAELLRDELQLGITHVDDFARCGATPHVWSDAMGAFYGATRGFCVPAAIWNRHPEKLKVRAWIGEYLAKLAAGRALEVLVFGDGPGFDSLYLALCGHRVTYFELPGLARTFAARLFASSGQSVTMAAALEEIPPAGFDAIVRLDVLEHIPDPTETVAHFARWLRPTGRSVVHAPFFFVSANVPTHLKSNRRFSGDTRRLYAPHGLRLVDGRAFWDPIVLAPRGAAGGSWAQRALLRATGTFLAVGRYWSGVHNWVADRTVFRYVNQKNAAELRALAAEAD